MKALILAAGKGTRLQPIHGDRPKCLIRFNDSRSTILDHQIRNLFSAGVRDIGIVVGYKKDQIIQHVFTQHHSRRRNFFFIENPIFAKTDNIFSFWLAQSWLHGEPFICLNGDIVFDPRILTPGMESTAPISVIVDPSGRYAGITIFAASAQQRLFAKVKRLIQADKQNESFDIAVQELAHEGLPVGYTGTGGLPWAEIDDPGDLAFARLYVFPRLASLPAAA
jgi:choline kinase